MKTMKALILAAGFGTRLLPHTAILPKPLFTLNGISVLQRCIEQLIEAGCSDIIINTHHLHHKIERFIDSCMAEKRFNVPVTTIHEAQILETGGAIKNVHNFMGNDNFIVINSDVVSDINLREAWDFHISGGWLATLLLHDYPLYNKVTVDSNLFIRDFSASGSESAKNRQTESRQYHNSLAERERELVADAVESRMLAFTGIQILSPEIFDHMPQKSCFSSIELYSSLARKGDSIKAFICKDLFWQDIGTPATYRDVAIRSAALAQFFKRGSCSTADEADCDTPISPSSASIESKSSLPLSMNQIEVEKLAGDGSDRGWYRCKSSDFSVIIADHGIHCDHHEKMRNYGTILNSGDIYNQRGIHNQSRMSQEKSIFHKSEEIDSFIRIGNHLFKMGVPVPQIKGYDRFAGLVVLEDLGDLHLQDVIIKIGGHKRARDNTNSNPVLEWYRKVCALAISFSTQGIKGFDDRWTFQTPSYSKEMILEKECRYFVEAFLQGYLKKAVKFKDFMEDFQFIADHALEHGFQGLMHRDLQSRNIMVRERKKSITEKSSLAESSESTDPYCLNSGKTLKENSLFFIDFQSARRGPLQYDLASLLIDPYVNLSEEIQETLLHECAINIEQLTGSNREKFIESYRYCAMARNMQMLGAFSHLSLNRGKSCFQQYIPLALHNLKKNIALIDNEKTGHLLHCIMDL